MTTTSDLDSSLRADELRRIDDVARNLATALRGLTQEDAVPALPSAPGRAAQAAVPGAARVAPPTIGDRWTGAVPPLFGAEPVGSALPPLFGSLPTPSSAEAVRVVPLA